MEGVTLSIATIDQHLSRQGSFCMIDWLLSQNLLQYPQFEAWRYGNRKHLDDALELDRSALRGLLSDAEEHCTALGLSSETQDFHHWQSEHPVRLSASDDATIHRRLTQQWLRPVDRPQLDLFMDNAAVVTENHLREALSNRRFDDAERHLEELSALNSSHAQLGRFQDLVNYGRHMSINPHIDEPGLTAELDGLQQEVEPLAREVLGPCARDYLAFAWRRLAANLPESNAPQTPRLHRSYALAQIPDWAAVRDCLQPPSAICRQPELLERLALACGALRQTEEALLLWCVLFERHTEYAENAIDDQPIPLLDTLWQDFWELGETRNIEITSAWFSAYLIACRPGLRHHLKKAPPLQQPATQAMLTVIEASLTQTDEIAARKQLKVVNPALLALYIGVQEGK